MGVIPILLFLKKDMFIWLNKPKLEPDLIEKSGLQMELFYESILFWTAVTSLKNIKDDLRIIEQDDCFSD